MVWLSVLILDFLFLFNANVWCFTVYFPVYVFHVLTIFCGRSLPVHDVFIVMTLMLLYGKLVTRKNANFFIYASWSKTQKKVPVTLLSHMDVGFVCCVSQGVCLLCQSECLLVTNKSENRVESNRIVDETLIIVPFTVSKAGFTRHEPTFVFLAPRC